MCIIRKQSRDSKQTAQRHAMNISKFVIQLKRSVGVQPSIREQFRQIIVNLIQAAMLETGADTTIITQTGLRKTVPYWYPYTTMAKMRWLGRELLEVVSTEFRDRSMEYYVRYYQWYLHFSLIGSMQRYALESGVTTVNGKIAKPDTVLKNGDRIEYVQLKSFFWISFSLNGVILGTLFIDTNPQWLLGQSKSSIKISSVNLSLSINQAVSFVC